MQYTKSLSDFLCPQHVVPVPCVKVESFNNENKKKYEGIIINITLSKICSDLLT